MAKCQVETCNKEDNGGQVCDEHEWIGDLERWFDDVMQELWEGDVWRALELFNEVSYTLNSHRYDKSMRG